MPSTVLDSWALLALFQDEPAADQVEDLLVKGTNDKHRLYLSAINWAEIYYSIMRTVSQEAAEARMREIAHLPIDIVGVAEDLKLTRQASIFKARYRISLADAFAAALAKEKRAQLATGDPEFQALAKEIKINWLE